LLDVNVLIALFVTQHQFHGQVEKWVKAQPLSTQFLITPIVELGFVRVVSQVSHYGINTREAVAMLKMMKRERSFLLISDDRAVDHLPKWVKSHLQVTDGHLVDLAQAHGALLATLDKQIADAFLIP
jgi:predicted nucleic acid-binding protein